jgi:riboflavin kinase / FMN adenylyltransferase
MNVYRNIEEIKYKKNTVATVGTFDGIHKAHSLILNKLIELTETNNSRSFVITFDPHPQEVLRNKTPEIKLLTTTEEKLEKFSALGIQNVLIIKFTKQFSETSAGEFYTDYLSSKMGLRELVIGYDHLFGRNREGSYKVLIELGEKLGFSVTRVEEVDVSGSALSSSRIRRNLNDGNIEQANTLLGYDYGMDCLVVEGDKAGRELGYPTANVQEISQKKIIPSDGVYCVSVIIEKKQYFGMMNIGYRPTRTDGIKKVMEINILNFSDDIYHKNIRVNFLSKMRNEIKFNSIDELKHQLNIDKENTLKFIKSKN